MKLTDDHHMILIGIAFTPKTIDKIAIWAPPDVKDRMMWAVNNVAYLKKKKLAAKAPTAGSKDREVKYKTTRLGFDLMLRRKLENSDVKEIRALKIFSEVDVLLLVTLKDAPTMKQILKVFPAWTYSRLRQWLLRMVNRGLVSKPEQSYRKKYALTKLADKVLEARQ